MQTSKIPYIFFVSKQGSMMQFGGFSLTEVLASLIIFSLASLVFIKQSHHLYLLMYQSNLPIEKFLAEISMSESLLDNSDSEYFYE